VDIEVGWVDHLEPGDDVAHSLSKQGRYDAPPSTNQSTYDYKEYNGRWFRYIGHRWANIELTGWPENTKFVDITVSISGHGMVGLWVPSSDTTVSDGPIPTAMFGYYYSENENLYVDCKKWEFGDEGKIRIYNTGPSDGDCRFVFSAFVRPVFSQPEDVMVTIRVDDPKATSVLNEQYHLVPGRQVSLDEDQPFLMKEVFDNFSKLEAMGYTGVGNIVHPKQYFTIRGFETIFKEFFHSSKKDIRIAYIGTDTTENIRSFVRWLNQSGSISLISEIRFFYTTDWDKDFLHFSGLERDLQREFPAVSTSFRELGPETINAQKELPQCDVVISTFVTPWVGGDARSEFAKLLRQIMHQDSYLLSVDPQNGGCSVRSELSDMSINNDDLYKSDLKFIVAKSSSKENPSVEWMVWKPTSESGVA
jgi:hypothetical protein